MAAELACIAGEEVYRQLQSGRISARPLGRRSTPFGQSNELLLVQAGQQEFYLLPRYGAGIEKTAPRGVNYRANIYALKEIGTRCVLAWGPGGAITHSIGVGDLVLLSDVIDMTRLRADTFFEDSPLGYLRQFPAFCPTLRKVVGDVLAGMKLVFHNTATAAVREGPRLETPAEIRMLAGMGAEIVTHTFAPEMFLARELEMCYAAVCYVVNYAETGSRHRPFAAGDLFGGLTQQSDAQRLSGSVAALGQIASAVASALGSAEKLCDCDQTMAANRKAYNLADDWRTWFKIK